MNILKRLFNWVQSGPVDFCYVSGEWGFETGITRPGIYRKEAGKILQIPAKLPAKPAISVPSKGEIAALAGSNIDAVYARTFQTTSDTYDPVLAELFSVSATPSAEEQQDDVYAHIHAER